MQDREQAVQEAPRATPAAPEGVPSAAQPLVARLLALQSLAGNRATAAYVQRTPGLTHQRGQGRRVAREVVDVGDEQLLLTDRTRDTGAAEAKAIIDRLSSEYGISVNSKRALEGVRAGYPHVEESVRNKVGTRRWSLLELKAVAKAADHFRPLLGKLRAASPRAGIAQEVRTVGKLDVAIEGSTVVGEYARGAGAVALYQHGETVEGDFGKDRARNAELTATHEFAHGLAFHAIDGFAACMRPPYWLGAYAKTNAQGAEAPPTNYGAENTR